VVKGIFQASKEALAVLAPYRLVVPTPGIAQNDPENVWPAFSTAGFDHPCPRPKIHLRLFSRRTLHPPEGQLLFAAQLPDKALHARIAALEALLGGQVLPDSLRRETPLQLFLDNPSKRLTEAFSPGGRYGWV